MTSEDLHVVSGTGQAAQADWRAADATDREAAADAAEGAVVYRCLNEPHTPVRELAEMSYQFDEPFVLDTSKYEDAFGARPTSLAAAVHDTLARYRSTGGAA